MLWGCWLKCSFLDCLFFSDQLFEIQLRESHHPRCAQLPRGTGRVCQPIRHQVLPHPIREYSQSLALFGGVRAAQLSHHLFYNEQIVVVVSLFVAFHISFSYRFARRLGLMAAAIGVGFSPLVVHSFEVNKSLVIRGEYKVEYLHNSRQGTGREYFSRMACWFTKIPLSANGISSLKCRT
jgi:hypothetical protein